MTSWSVNEKKFPNFILRILLIRGGTNKQYQGKKTEFYLKAYLENCY